MQAAFIQISIHWKYIGTAEKITNNRTDLKISAFFSNYDKNTQQEDAWRVLEYKAIFQLNTHKVSMLRVLPFKQNKLRKDSNQNEHDSQSLSQLTSRPSNFNSADFPVPSVLFQPVFLLLMTLCL